MANPIEGATEYVESVKFGFLTTEEAKKYGPVKITNTTLLDSVERPVPGGLYDPSLGPLDEKTPCKSCGLRSYLCPGHFGRIDLCSLVYNPLLFDDLYNLIRGTCFFCHHFKAKRTKVETCISQLALIAKGDVSGAKNLDSDFVSSGNSSYPEDSDGSHVSCPKPQYDSVDDQTNQSKRQEWTSLQETEAMSILRTFLKQKSIKCERCQAKGPKITKPTFGWLSMHMDGARARSNVISGCVLEDDSDGGLALSEVESTNESQDTPRKKRGKDGGETSARFSKQTRVFSGPLLPPEVENIIKSLWENEPLLCSFISNVQQRGNCSMGKEAGYSMFFLKTILVTPIKFRPPAKGGDSVMEHPHTVLLNKILQCNISLREAAGNEKFGQSVFVSRWRDLQLSINVYFNSKSATGTQKVDSGICQVLEKKEGLFRQKMMGKRVNHACRSVISPDNNLAVNEIGIPPYFATRLTYPERVTPWNVNKLREAIVNGPSVHPGATRYVDKISTKMLPSDRKSRIAISRRLPSSRGAVTQSGKATDPEYEGKVVYRHLKDGDIVLVNRQPTLHKPSIMAHVVRVLKGERTLRMHYANCSTYNADFDGDEMNVHFPQDEISRAEAYNIVNANNQYVKPTNGDPVRALIQDHIVSAALLTKKDTFLTRDEFNQLLYTSGVSTSGMGSFSKKTGKKVSLLDSEDEIEAPLPAIWKPEPLWTGKQVITAMLNHITRDQQPFTVKKECKIPPMFFKNKTAEISLKKSKDSKEKGKGKDQSKKNGHGEDMLYIHNNDLVHGVIDKAQFAEYGLVHKVQVLYGSNTAGVLLSTMSRLFTAFLQMHGFTCGLDDLLIKEDKDLRRKMQLEEATKSGGKIHRDFVGIKGDAVIDPKELQTKVEEYVRRNGESALMSLDRKMLSGLNEFSQKVNRELLSEGLWKPSGKNCISLMTISGAKGGTVNFQQISSYLGSQELEGKRVPRMVSGKTLPCFPPWDFSSRAGGFIIDRFLTGLRPQEYYFHCMAGREGLVDTAVKTSRSGYLQRCLIKNLECLKVSYDHTVRDADGSIVQFIYGEDGVDVHRSKYLSKFEVLAMNPELKSSKLEPEPEANAYIGKLPPALAKKAEDFIEKLTLNERITSGFASREEFMESVKRHYLLNLAQPGEPVGVLSAQSVGEPSTQMTLNTFHLAGRGEMNVTLGIPRLQEILMTASSDIKTPIMTCPLQEGRTQEDATHLALELKKISIADLIGTLKVSVGPFSLCDSRICRIYKLEMKLSAPHLGISVDKCEETLSTTFLRELEDAIQSNISLLSKINGIQSSESDSQPNSSNETEEDSSHDVSRVGEEEEDDVGEEADDLGLDAKKQKRQATDEMDYEDGSEDEQSALPESEVDNAQEDTDEDDDTVGVSSEPVSPKLKSSDTKTKPEEKKKKKALTKKDTDRAIFVEAKGLRLKAHFKLIDEPHILLAQIAERAAKKVYVQSSGKVDNCAPTNCKESQVIYYGKDPKKRTIIDPKELEEMPALQTTGVDFGALWKLQEALDVRYIYSNSIHDMLNTYGVEAARETLMREINHVFKSYGILVNHRHLSLIADFMTHAGGYRPMSRLGGIADSPSPFSKMTFETASKFIVEAAYHGTSDNLDTPSARICLGLPVKMGTGCFDLMQKLEIE